MLISEALQRPVWTHPHSEPVSNKVQREHGLVVGPTTLMARSSLLVHFEKLEVGRHQVTWSDIDQALRAVILKPRSQPLAPTWPSFTAKAYMSLDGKRDTEPFVVMHFGRLETPGQDVA